MNLKSPAAATIAHLELESLVDSAWNLLDTSCQEWLEQKAKLDATSESLLKARLTFKEPSAFGAHASRSGIYLWATQPDARTMVRRAMYVGKTRCSGGFFQRMKNHVSYAIRGRSDIFNMTSVPNDDEWPFAKTEEINLKRQEALDDPRKDRFWQFASDIHDKSPPQGLKLRWVVDYLKGNSIYVINCEKETPKTHPDFTALIGSLEYHAEQLVKPFSNAASIAAPCKGQESEVREALLGVLSKHIKCFPR